MNRILWLVVSVFTILFYYLLLSCHNFDDNHPHHFIISHMPSNINEGKLMNSLVPSKETEGFDAGKCILIDNLRSNYQQQDVVVKCFPLFIIAGSMKCGTGEMMKWLQLHPLLRVGKGKTKINERETHYFTRHISQQTIYNNSNVYKADLLRNYLEHFPFFTLKESKTLYNFEKSPDYIRSITALKIIKSVLPNISLIILLRDPVKRALSEFFHHCRHKRYIKFIQEYNTSTVYYNRNAIVNGATGLLQGIPTYYYSTLLSCDMQHAEIYFTASILLKRKHYVEELLNGLYYNQLLGLLKIYSSNKVLILLQEEMYRNTFGILKEVEDFLDISHFNYSSVSKNIFTDTVSSNSHPPKRLNDKVLFTISTRSGMLKRNSEELYNQSSFEFRKLLENFYYDQNRKLLSLLIYNNYTSFSKLRLEYNGWKL